MRGMVTGAHYKSRYSQQVFALAQESARVISLGAVWDQALLDQLYAHCTSYLHGHSVGGTNPSLLRALGAAAPVIAWDVVFNHEVTADQSHYVQSPESVTHMLQGAETDTANWKLAAERLREPTLARYNWDSVAAQYLELAQS